jgi:hypothetical protein
MRVRCISTTVSPHQRERLGRRTYLDMQAPDLTVGKEYLVLGFEFIADSARIRTGPYVWVLADSDNLAEWFDLCLFTVTDRRLSRYWVLHEATGVAHEQVRLWPAQWEAALARSPQYPTQLFQGEPEAVAEFQRLYILLDTEFDETTSG